MSKPNSQPSTENTSPKKKTSKKFRLGSCLVKLLIVGGLCVGSLFLAQSLLVPPIDPELDVPLEISHGNAEVESPNSTDPDGQNSEPQSTDGLEKGTSQKPDAPKLLTDTISVDEIAAADHPLKPLMGLATKGVDFIENNIDDYTARIVSRVRIGKRLGVERIMFVKIRHQKNKLADEKVELLEPFSVYTKFLKPRNLAGQEAIWIKGENDDQISAHAAGLFNVKTVNLDPLSSFAMNGSRHPIFKIGFKNLIVQMLEYAKNDIKYKECEVTVERKVMVGKHQCTMLKIVHPVWREHFEYHIAKIYLDDHRQIPIGYEGYLWPKNEGEEPPLLERYFYTDIKLNVGLTDKDFDSKNEEYEFPDW